MEDKLIAMNVRKIPLSTFLRFKAACVIENKTIQEKVIELIEAATAETLLEAEIVINTDKE